jgi:hypothetical protein
MIFGEKFFGYPNFSIYSSQWKVKKKWFRVGNNTKKKPARKFPM